MREVSTEAARRGRFCGPGRGEVRRAVFARVEADAVAVGVGDPRHPAHARLDRLDENLRALAAAGFDGGRDVVDGEGDARGAVPVPLRVGGAGVAVEAKREWLGGELGPEIVPLVAAFEAEKVLVEGARAAEVLRIIHYEIEGADGDEGFFAGEGFRGEPFAGHGAMRAKGRGEIEPGFGLCAGRERASAREKWGCREGRRVPR